MILSVLPVDSAVKTTLLETSHSIILHDVPRSSDQHRLRTKGMKQNYLVSRRDIHVLSLGVAAKARESFGLFREASNWRSTWTRLGTVWCYSQASEELY